MDITDIKRIASDCKTTHRWAILDNHTIRIIGIGRKYVRLMNMAGKIWNEEPSRILRVW